MAVAGGAGSGGIAAKVNQGWELCLGGGKTTSRPKAWRVSSVRPFRDHGDVVVLTPGFGGFRGFFDCP